VELFMRAASLNHPAALTNLGSMYCNGTAVDRCRDKGIEYYSRAAK
jgi:TPR repeat protein